jgi:hypothetical protein
MYNDGEVVVIQTGFIFQTIQNESFFLQRFVYSTSLGGRLIINAHVTVFISTS